MLRSASFFYRCVFILLLMISNSIVYANQDIKLAILDNTNLFSKNISFSADLQSSYMRGIQTAVIEAKEEGYNIQYKPFLYGSSVLEIATKVPDVKAWQPDVIMGLYHTDQFLMARNYFNDIMVISLFASDYQLKNLPNNFHSMAVSDSYIAEIFPRLITDKFPHHNIFLAIGADSKESEDMAYLVKSIIKKKYKNISITESEYIQDEISTLNVEDLLKNYHKGDVIVLLCSNYYDGAELMSRISKHLAPYVPFFITDFDNWGEGMVPTQNLYPYHAYRISPYLLNPDTDVYRNFYKEYEKIYNEPPKDQVAFQTYSAVTSVVHALILYSKSNKVPMRENILQSYQKAIAKDPFWFRQTRLWIYEMTPGKDVLLNFSYPFFDYAEP